MQVLLTDKCLRNFQRGERPGQCIVAEWREAKWGHTALPWNIEQRCMFAEGKCENHVGSYPWATLRLLCHHRVATLWCCIHKEHLEERDNLYQNSLAMDHQIPGTEETFWQLARRNDNQKLLPSPHHQKPPKNKAKQKNCCMKVNVWSFTIPRVYQSQITNVPAVRTFSVLFLSSQSQFTTTLEELVWERRNWIAEWRKGGELSMHSLSHYSISPLRQAWVSRNEKL